VDNNVKNLVVLVVIFISPSTGFDALVFIDYKVKLIERLNFIAS